MTAMDRVNSLFDLTGRVALVSGGSQGLGKAMALGLAGAGATVVIVSRTESKLAETTRELYESYGARAAYVVGDLTRPGESQRVAEAARRLVGAIDILINNAGGNIAQRVEDVTDVVWADVLTLNLSAAMALTRAVVPDMCARGWGRVLNVSSVSAYRPFEGRAAYASAKSGLIGLTRAVALDLGRFGVTVNALAPGFFPTELTASAISDSAKQQYIDRTALRRLGDTDDLVGPMLLLVSNAGAYITGQVMVIDGGWLLG